MKKLIIITSLFFTCTLFSNEYPDISVDELQAALKEGKVALIDVNGPKSFSRGHIPTAINFSTDSNKLSKLLPKDKNTLIVSYCGGPGCRAYKKGAEAAAKLGYKNIRHLSAGISGWRKSGAKVVKK
jgi:rhodanese-related sulfurtransferase